MSSKAKVPFKQIAIEQKKPLNYKIKKAIKWIQRGFDVCGSRPAIAFSGGKDSTVLWHLIKTYFPEQHAQTAIIFGNTCNEFPESLKFARQLGDAWGGDNFYEAKPALLEKDELKYEAQKQVIEFLIETGQIQSVLKEDNRLKSEKALERACPPEMMERFRKEGLIWKAGTPKNYWWCVDKYGYPLLGKAFSKLKAQRANIDCFLAFSETESKNEKTLRYYDVLRKVKISQACCDILKKEPSERIQAELKIDVIFKGLTAAESRNRKINFAKRGYLFESKREYIDIPFYHCNPMQIWTDDDIWEYIRRFNVPYSPLYDCEYTNAQGEICKMKRNGCIGCFTDYGRKNSHMYVMRQTHPKAWETIMRRGMAEEIQKLRTCGVKSQMPAKKDYARLAILGAMNELDGEELSETLAWAIENRPCAFD